MRRARPPWWVLTIAGFFLFCAGFLYYLLFFGPEKVGWDLRPAMDQNARDFFAVRSVRAGSTAARAGFQAGDLIHKDEAEVFFAKSRGGGPYRFEIARDGERKILSINLAGKGWRFGVEREGPGILAIIITSMLCLTLALVLLFARPHDLVARWGALFLAKLGELTAVGPFFRPWLTQEFQAAFIHLPIVLGTIVLLVLSLSLMIPATATTFLGHFPRTPFRNRRMALMIWVPAVVTIPLDLSWFWLPVYSRPGAVSIPVWMIMLGTMLGFGYCIGALILLGRNYFQGVDPNERRRIRVLAVGFAVTISAVAFSILQFIPWRALHRVLEAFRRNWPASFIVTLFYGVAPLCMAYAILRHRMFEIRVMVRLGLRYAAARGLLLSVVPLIGLLLGFDLLTHGNQTLLEILGRRGWIYGILGLGAFLLHARRKIWLDALDRRFFRERYDAQKILRDVVEDIRQAASLEEASPKVISQIERALHPEFAVLVLREADSKEYRTVAPSAGAFPSIHAESKLIALTRLLDKPIEISQEETGWLRRQLPEKEANFLEQSRLEWIFPVSMGGSGTEAFLALGAKKSEEPYSREDKDLIEAITGSLALLLEKGAITGRVSLEAGFKECSKCGICCEAATEGCPEDGAALSFVPFPRLFARRYRLDRRLGQGGMGTVYRAFDTELDRNVAIKMIRQEFLASAEITARFKREAKAAAGFAHPNVVTIYDFGVTEDSRAYIIMEFLEGVTLREELATQQRLKPEMAVKIFREVCGAVEAAHERRLLHRDLKPENIFLARSPGREAAKILDFGIAKLMVSREDTLTAHAATEPGLIIGTFRYMSPEQLRGEAPSESWDLWALAVVAFEILTGVHPFGSSPDWQNAVLTGRFVPIRKHIPQAPEAWQEFFERALAVKPSKRPASARELCDEFKKAIA